MNIERIFLIRKFETVAHQTQTRKYSGRPYIEHPLAVAWLGGTIQDFAVASVIEWLEYQHKIKTLNIAGPVKGNGLASTD